MISVLVPSTLHREVLQRALECPSPAPTMPLPDSSPTLLSFRKQQLLVEL